MARLAAHVWVGAYLARLAAEGVPAHLVRRGDPTAGAVAVKLALMDGTASLFTRHYDASGKRVWDAMIEAGPEEAVDAALARQARVDPDLWVVEVEDPRGRHLLDRPGLEE